MRIGLRCLACLAGIAMAAAVVVLASASSASAQTGRSYSDVPDDAYYTTPVSELDRAGVFNGTVFDELLCPEGFCPSEPVDRKTMAVWVVRVLDGHDPPRGLGSRFDDVDCCLPDFWPPFIERMAELEVTRGCGDGSGFCPNRSISRAEMAVFLSRAFDLPDGPDPGFSDVPDDAWYAADAARLAASGITLGCGDGTKFCPSRTTTRAEMATFLHRAMDGSSDVAVPAHPDVFYTAENRLSRFIKHEVVDKYGEQYPWLIDTWNYSNSPDFKYWLRTCDDHIIRGGVFSEKASVDAGGLTFFDCFFESDAGSYLGIRRISTIFHEYAHLYSLRRFDRRPGAMAIAIMYFERYLGSGCDSKELYANAVEAALMEDLGARDYRHLDHADGSVSFGYSYYLRCLGAPSSPSAEDVAVVRSSLNGEMPEWFYDTFELPDGTLDYDAIWRRVIRLPSGLFSTRLNVARSLREEFGGYCSEEELFRAMRSLDFDPRQAQQPWRDGGCDHAVGSEEPDESGPEQEREQDPAPEPGSSTGTYRSVTIGAGHLCALRTDGTVACWGSNNDGQADPPEGTFKALAAGHVHTCGLRTDSTVACWGNPSEGQAYAPEGTFKALAAADLHTCGLRTDGTIACWDEDSPLSDDLPPGRYKAIANGTSRSNPFSFVCALRENGTIVCTGADYLAGKDAVPDGNTFKAISAGFQVGCAIDTDNNLVCWGQHAGKTDVPDGQYESVSVGYDHVCAVRVDRTIACWGGSEDSPIRTDVPQGSYKSVAALSSSACAIRVDDILVCWGHSDDIYTSPHEWILQGTIRAASVGKYHICILRSNDTITCLGLNRYGQADAPQGTFKSLASGSQHTCALRSDNTITCWGDNLYGQADAPQGTFKSLASGSQHTCALRSDDTITCWGDNDFGQTDAPHGTYRAVAASASHTCALRSSRTIACWGNNGASQTEAPDGTYTAITVGDGGGCALSTDDTVKCWKYAPWWAPKGSYTAIAGGLNHVCALRADGAVVCWVAPYSSFRVQGVSAQGTFTPQGTFSAIFAGGRSTCALRIDGYFICWGNGGTGLEYVIAPS